MAFGIDRHHGSIALGDNITGLCSPQAHGVLEAGTSTLFHRETEARGTLLFGEFHQMPGG
jgi:hypothetical protein